jgi:hypothetical protein
VWITAKGNGGALKVSIRCVRQVQHSGSGS